MQNVFKLSNGLRVVTEKIDTVKSVSVGIWIETGSRNEDKVNNGISHFIEHMMFKGTEKRTALELAESIENVGGQMNAFTGREATCYYIKVLDENLELSLDILSDMMFHSKFSEEDIEKEKGVVIEEINMSEDSPEDVLADLHSTAIWGEDSISLPILGTVDTLRSFSRKLILEYIGEYYIPENSVISICGNFEDEKLYKYLEKYFSPWKSLSNKRVTKYSTPIILPDILYKDKPIEQLHFSLGLMGYELGDDKGYTLTLINNILGGGASSILFQKIREELGLCYSIYSYMSSYNNTGTLNIYAGLSPKYAERALNVIKEQLVEFAEKGISDTLLTTTKNKIKANYILGLESTSSRMFANGKTLLFLNKVNSQEDIMNKINSIHNQNVSKVMQETIEKGIINAAFVGNNFQMDSILPIIGEDKKAFPESSTILV